MNQRSCIFLAATMALGGVSFAPMTFADPPQGVGPAQVNGQVNAEQTNSVSAVRTLIGHSVEAAVRENGFNDLTADFAAAPTTQPMDAAHASSANAAAQTPSGNQGQAPSNVAGTIPKASDGGAASAAKAGAAAASGTNSTANAVRTAATDVPPSNVSDTDMKNLNAQIAQFRQAFKAKYGQDFMIKDPQAIYSDITAANLDQMQAQPAAAELPANNAPADHAAAMPAPGTTTLDVPKYQDGPAVTIDLVRDGSQYHYAARQPLNQPMLAANVLHCITAVNNAQANWPADADTAERLVSQHILGAIAKTQNQQMPDMSDQMPSK